MKYKSNLKEIRQAAGITLDQVVEGTGVIKRTLITTEKEEGVNPSVNTVKRLIKYFKFLLKASIPCK